MFSEKKSDSRQPWVMLDCDMNSHIVTTAEIHENIFNFEIFMLLKTLFCGHTAMNTCSAPLPLDQQFMIIVTCMNVIFSMMSPTPMSPDSFIPRVSSLTLYLGSLIPTLSNISFRFSLGKLVSSSCYNNF